MSEVYDREVIEADIIEAEVENCTDDIAEMLEDHEQKKKSKTVKERMTEKFADEKEAKSFISDCKDYLDSSEFDKKCSKLSKLYKVEKKKIAETFCQKVLATIGDTLGMVITVTYNACKFLVKLLSKLLNAGCGIIFSIAIKLTSFFTLGYTRA